MNFYPLTVVFIFFIAFFSIKRKTAALLSVGRQAIHTPISIFLSDGAKAREKAHVGRVVIG